MDLLWTHFLNSMWHDWRGSGTSEDRLNRPDWLPKFLRHWGITAPPPPTAAELAALKELRALLQSMTETLVAGAPLPEAGLARLNAALAGGPVVRRIVESDKGRRLEYLPLRHDWPQVMAEIAASFGRTLAEGESARVRICENPDCLWVFYDDTRNRTKRFCDEKGCGNLMKVRRFRARRKVASDQA